MKYGETLRQRSIPEWAYHNIDYDDIKLMIKERTTPGKGRATSVPGQGNEVELEFENLLFSIFEEQHSRITLFVKSKIGETGRRLDHLEKQLRQLQLSGQKSEQGTRSRREKYSRIERDAVAAGGEIRSLSRFVGANHTAFNKLLKKYRKWTRSDALGVRVKAEILGRADSFTRISLDAYLDHWTDILQEVRDAQAAQNRLDLLYAPPNSTSPSPLLRAQAQSSFRQSSTVATHSIRTATCSGSEIDFDLALSNTSLGEAGRKAVYWVHREQLIELQVLLLQYLRPYPAKLVFSASAQTASPSKTRRSSTLRANTLGEGRWDTGVIILDRLEDFTEAQNGSPISDTEEFSGGAAVLASANVRWTSYGDAALTICKKQQKFRTELKDPARIKRKQVATFLDVDRRFSPPRNSPPGSLDVDDSPQTDEEAPLSQSSEDAREWLTRNKEVKPLVCICSKRSRFIGLAEGQPSGQWCILDTDISMAKTTLEDLVAKEWPVKSRNDGWSFPHAVLEVRQEGKVANNLIELLDRSHLTERVRGFSLTQHAVWTCWKPRAMTAPFWLPVLARDIRKVPDAVIRRPRRQSSGFGPQSSVASFTKASTGSVDSETQGGAGSSTAVGESSATSTSATPLGPTGQEPSPPKQKRKKKRALAYLDEYNNDYKKGDTYNKNRYWSEYDHPEDRSDDGNAFYIYLDPSEPSVWPGHSAYVYIKDKLIALFQARLHRNASFDTGSAAERAMLAPRSKSASESSGDDSSSSEDGFATGLPPTSHLKKPAPGSATWAKPSHLQDYGTLPPPALSLDTSTLPTLRVSTSTLIAALAVISLLSVLAATSRRKARAEVDAAIVFGVAAALALVLFGATALLRERRSEYVAGGSGARRRSVRLVLFAMGFAAECVACGLLLGWVLGGFG